MRNDEIFGHTRFVYIYWMSSLDLEKDLEKRLNIRVRTSYIWMPTRYLEWFYWIQAASQIEPFRDWSSQFGKRSREKPIELQ